MFQGATNFNQAVDKWNVSKVTSMRSMFEVATSFNQDLCAWYNKLKLTTDVNNMFIGSGCDSSTDPDTKDSFCQACNCNYGK
jgi:surface protein